MTKSTVKNKTKPPIAGHGRKRSKSETLGYEFAANQGARAVVRGEGRVPKSAFMSAPTARFDLPGSRAERLSVTLRDRLETGLNADLEQVLVHRDAAATEAVRALGVRAFTAGRRIFIDREAYLPENEGSLGLLAHEATHVLQQTGRPDGAGRLRATHAPWVANAPIQCKGHDELPDPDWGELAGKDVWNEVKKAHLAIPVQGDEKSDLRGLINDIGDEIGGKLLVGQAPEAFTSTVSSDLSLPDLIIMGSYDMEWPALRAFLYDIMKTTGQWAAADSLVFADPYLKTPLILTQAALHFIHHPEKIDLYFGRGQKNDVRVALNTFLLGAKNVLFAPSRMNFDDDASAYKEALKNKINKTKKRIHRKLVRLVNRDATNRQNELFTYALNYITFQASRYFDSLHDHVDDVEEAYRKEVKDKDALVHPAYYHYQMCFVQLGGTKNILHRRFLAMSERAKKIWEPQSGTLSTMETAFKNAEKNKWQLTTLNGLEIKGLPETKLISIFKEMIIWEMGTGDNQLFRLKPQSTSGTETPDEDTIGETSGEKHTLPDAELYGKAASDFRNLLILLRSDLHKGLRLFNAPKINDSERGAIALVLFWIDMALARVFKETSFDDDDKARLARIKAAHYLHILAQLTKWDELEQAVAPIIDAEDVGEVYLVIAGKWEPKPHVPMSSFADDMGKLVYANDKNDMALGDPSDIITAYRMYNFDRLLVDVDTYYAENTKGIEAKLNAGIPLADEDFAKVIDPDELYNRAQREAYSDPSNNSRRLFKFEATEAFFIGSPEKTATTKTAKDFIFNHPKTNMATIIAAWPNAGGYSPRTIDIFAKSTPGESVFLWAAPDPGLVAEQMRDMLEHVVPGADIPIQKDNQNFWDWLVEVNEWRRLNAPADVAAKYKAEQDARMALSEKQHTDTLARSTTLYRRVLAEQLKREMDEIGKGILDNKAIAGTGFLGARLIPALRTFRQEVPLSSHTAPQFTLLMLELAPSMNQIQDNWLYSTAYSQLVALADYALYYIEISKEDSEKSNKKSVWYEGITPEILGPGWVQKISNDEGILHKVRGAELTNRIDELKDFREKLVAWRGKNQENTGFISDGSAFRDVLSSHSMGIGYEDAVVLQLRYPIPTTPDIFLGLRYFRLKNMTSRSFKYHPKVDDRIPAKLEYTNSKGEPIAPVGDDEILFELGCATVTGEGEKQTVGEEEDITVRGGDKEKLRAMSSVLEERSRLISIQELADDLAMGVDVALTVVEMIPGFGQLVTAARAAYGLRELLNSDLPKIKDEIFDNLSKDSLEALISDFTDKISTDTLWDWFLEDQPTSKFGAFLQGQINKQNESKRNQAAKRTGGKGKKLARLVSAVASIGGRFAKSFMRLHGNMRVSLSGARAEIQTRPRLAALINRADDFYYQAEAAVTVAGSVRTQMRADFKSVNLSNLVVTLMEGLNSVEIPEKVFPLDLLVEVILSTALNKIFGAKGKVVRIVLQRTGALSEIAGEIAAALDEKGFDPNELWKEKAFPLVKGHVEDARNNVAEHIRVTVNSIAEAVGSPHIGKLNLGDIKIEDPGFPEAEGHATGDGSPRSNQIRALPTAGGSLPDKGLLRTTENRFGHDLSHLRLYGGKVGESVSGAFGADGITSGSRVYMGKGLSPAHGKGQKVFYHEISHVLQQTGSRPLGGKHSSAPLSGTPGKGFRYDKTRESGADKMAANALGNKQTVHRPMPVEGQGGEGLAPAPNAVAIKILKSLSDSDKATDFAKLFEETASPALSTIKASELKRAEIIVGSIKRKVKKLKKWGGSKLNQKSLKNIKGLINKKLAKVDGTGDADLKILVDLALKKKKLRGSAGGQRANSRPGADQILDADVFVSLVEYYIFSTTGLSLKIKSKTTTKNPKKTTVSSIALQDVSLGGLDLSITEAEGLSEAEALFDIAISNSKANKEVLYKKFKRTFPNMPGSPGWSKTKFRLNKSYLADILGELTKAKTKITADDLPSWKEYVNPPEDPKKPGLHIKTHHVLTNLPISIRKDRQSHHLPQYLLIEFLQNKVNKSLFGESGEWWVPGFSDSSDNQIERDQVADKKPVKVANLNYGKMDSGGESKRGLGMPAISLAARTHQKGRLHIARPNTWNSDEGVPGQRFTQGVYVREEFRTAFLHNFPGGKPVVGADGFNQEAIRENRGKAKTATGKAVKKLYKIIVDDHMGPPLKKALVEHEAQYYMDITNRIENDPTEEESKRIIPNHMDSQFKEFMKYTGAKFEKWES